MHQSIYWFAVGATAYRPRNSFVLFRRKILGVVISLLIAIFIASVFVIMLSPTMYASGMRTLYVPSIALMMAVYILIDRFIDQRKHIRSWVVGIIVGAGLLQYAYLLQSLSKQV